MHLKESAVKRVTETWKTIQLKKEASTAGPNNTDLLISSNWIDDAA